MACITLPIAMLISGGLAAAGGVASGMIGARAARSAAKTQSEAAARQSDATLAMFGQVQSTLKPFVGAGQNALNMQALMTGTNAGGNPATAPLTRPFNPTMAELENTPGYKFTLEQGRRAVQNAFTAQGLGQSGAAMRGGIDYAEGLASTTFQQQFENYLKQNSQIYNMLGGISSLGANAAGTTGQFAMGAQGQASNIALGGASATAAGTVGAANALTGGISSAASGVGNAALMLGMNNAGMFARPGATPAGAASATNVPGYNMLFGGYNAPK